MNKAKSLILIPTLFTFFSCRQNLPPRKTGDTCVVTFNGENVTAIDCPSEAPMDQELSFSLDIPYLSDPTSGWKEVPSSSRDGVLVTPNEEYEVSPSDIHVYIGGKEYKDSYNFYYLNNIENKFTIKKEYMVNDVEIKIAAKPIGRLFLYGFQFSKSLDERIDYSGHDYDEDVDEDGGDIEIEFGSVYQNVRYEIRTLSGQRAFPTFWHDELKVKLKVKDGANRIPLPGDICLRINARYATKDLDFFCEYSDEIKDKFGHVTGYGTCDFRIPRFFIRDHGIICKGGEK